MSHSLYIYVYVYLYVNVHVHVHVYLYVYVYVVPSHYFSYFWPIGSLWRNLIAAENKLQMKHFQTENLTWK